jgi:hypothetical protein
LPFLLENGIFEGFFISFPFGAQTLKYPLKPPDYGHILDTLWTLSKHFVKLLKMLTGHHEYAKTGSAKEWRLQGENGGEGGGLQAGEQGAE